MHWIAVLTALAVLASASAQPAAASSASYGRISQVYAMNNGAVLFSTDGTRTNDFPGCQSAGVRYAIDASTTGGQAAASMLATAYALKKRIRVQGTETCTIWSDTETVLCFQIED